MQCSPVGGCAGSPDGSCWVRAVWGEEASGSYYFSDLVDGYFSLAHPDPAGRAFSVRCLFLTCLYDSWGAIADASWGPQAIARCVFVDLTTAHILQLCDSGLKGSVQCSPVGGCAGASDGNCWVRAVWGAEEGGHYYFLDLVDGSFSGVHADPAEIAFSVRFKLCIRI